MTDEATAFVPGHVTGFFTTDPDDDPTKAGSRGGGVALSDGVTVTVRASEERSVALNGVDIEIEAVDRVLDALRTDVAVRAETPLPLGSGFGVSGAMALGTALGAHAVRGTTTSTPSRRGAASSTTFWESCRRRTYSTVTLRP